MNNEIERKGFWALLVMMPFCCVLPVALASGVSLGALGGAWLWVGGGLVLFCLLALLKTSKRGCSSCPSTDRVGDERETAGRNTEPN